MTIAELIAALGEFPPDWEVRAPYNESGHCEVVVGVERDTDRFRVPIPTTRPQDGLWQWQYKAADAVWIRPKYM